MRLLAEMAVSETGLGRASDKITKNLLVINQTPGIEDLEPFVWTGDHGLTLVEWAPYGIIGAAGPSTNPSETVINNGISMIAGGNAVVFAPHPSAKRTCQTTISLFNQAMVEAGGRDAWRRVMDASAELHERLRASGHAAIAAYAVAMAYRVRFYMDMNAREAMHVIELRSAPQGHPAYRRVCQRMHTLIAEQAGHRAIAGAMQFADHSEVALERLNAERALEARRARSEGAAQ